MRNAHCIVCAVANRRDTADNREGSCEKCLKVGTCWQIPLSKTGVRQVGTHLFSFVATYCNERFGSDWHLSPEASLAIYAGSTAILSQVLVYAKAGKNNNLPLQDDTSIFDYKTPVRLT